MPLLVPDVGEVILLDVLAAEYNAAPYRMHLYQNNHIPGDADTVADYTECTFSGYASVDITTWGAASIVSSRAQIVADLQTFTHDGGATGNDVFGYYITNAAGFLVWAEIDPDAPVTVDTGGQQYNVLPRFTLRSQP